MDLDKATEAVAELLVALGVDEDDHTRDTPGRVARAWAEVLAGYGVNPARHLRTTFTGPPTSSLVVVAGIRLVTTCAHHLMPVTGVATVAYRPRAGARVVGLSKLARVVEDYARRLQVQERLTCQVAATVADELNPLGAGCVVTATHGCMSVRGVRQPASVTTTSSWHRPWEPAHPDAVTVLAEHRAAVSAVPRRDNGGT